MSRIERSRVKPGEVTDATTLNDTYADYTQSATLDASNTRDQAFGLPHLATSGSPLMYAGQASLGNNTLPTVTGAPTTTVSSASGSAPTSPHVVQTSTGTETILDLSSDPWSLGSGDVLRVWWHLTCRPKYTGTPWTASNVLGKLDIAGTASATDIQTVTDSMHCWVAYLQWDITSASLTNFVDVPGQGDFLSSIDSKTGSKLADTSSTTVIPAWLAVGTKDSEDGAITGAIDARGFGFDSAYGMYARKTVASRTVYGVRLVIRGLLHPAHDTTGSVNPNTLVYALNAVGTLDYCGGRINAVAMREK